MVPVHGDKGGIMAHLKIRAGCSSLAIQHEKLHEAYCSFCCHWGVTCPSAQATGKEPLPA